MKARALIRQGAKRLKDSPAIDHWQKGREKIEAEILLFDLLGEEPDPDDKISASIFSRPFCQWSIAGESLSRVAPCRINARAFMSATC